jgi:hypothetical protein
MRLNLNRVAAAMSHTQCVHFGVRALNFVQDELPPASELRFVVHARIGGSPIPPDCTDWLRLDLTTNQAYTLVQPDVFARPCQAPGVEHTVSLHLFGIISGINPGHSLGTAQAWFPQSERLIRTAMAEHVYGRSAIAFGPCWTPGEGELPRLPELHDQIYTAIIQGGRIVQPIPSDYAVLGDDAPVALVS